MNDYLWDKTGSDPEIEEFENSLSEFRYHESSAPALPAKVVEFPVKPRPKKLYYTIAAAAACLLFFAAMSVVMTPFSKSDPGEEMLAKIMATENTLPVVKSDKSLMAGTDRNPETIPASGQKTDAAAATLVAKPARIFKPRNTAVVASPTSTPPVKLTKEEVYAYDQLKLALSITGSKLKLIKDKVNSGEEKPAAPKDIKTGR